MSSIRMSVDWVLENPAMPKAGTVAAARRKSRRDESSIERVYFSLRTQVLLSKLLRQVQDNLDIAGGSRHWPMSGDFASLSIARSKFSNTLSAASTLSFGDVIPDVADIVPRLRRKDKRLHPWTRFRCPLRCRI